MSAKESVKTLEQQLIEAGGKLLQPPSSVEEVLCLLDLSESALGKVEQSPGKSMHDAISCMRKALVSDELLGHPDTDVKVSVASCINEITRITAPDAPYGDEDMKRVFQLIVSSFENLSDKSSRSYNKSAAILETVAKVRSCVIMLDLECDDLITEMFQIFFRTIRDYHSDNIFTSMATIMNLVLEESEEVSTDLLTTLLSSLKNDNEEVPHIARLLSEKLLLNCAVKLKPYLAQAIKNSDISLYNYSKIVTSVCEETVGEDASNTLVQKPNDDCIAAAVSIGVTQEGDGCKAAEASSEATREGDGSTAAAASSKETLVRDDIKAVAASSEETQENVKDVERECLGDKSLAGKRSPYTTVGNGINVTSKEKTSGEVESSQKEETSENNNKSTNDESMSKPEPHALGNEKSTVFESKSKKTSKNRRKKARSSSKRSVESSDPSHVDDEKEDTSPEVMNVESNKETGDTLKGANTASPKSADEADEDLPKRDGHQQEKQCATQGEISSPERLTEKESEKTSDSGEASGESPTKKAPEESPLKDETSVEVGTSKHDDSGTSDSEDKPVKKFLKKLDLSDSDDDDDSPLIKKGDSIKRARTKARFRKIAPKSSTKDDVKVVVSSQNRTTKSPKVEKNHSEILPKRKRSLGKEAFGSLQYGKNLIRSKVKVWWPMDQQFYEGVIVSYDSDKRKHLVVYDDGDQELLNLRKEKWQLSGDDSVTVTEDDDAEPASTDASSEMPKSKKGKRSATSFVKQQESDDISPKRLSASSSKSKGKSSRSGNRTKNGKGQTKFKDRTSKSGVISEDESESKSKTHSQSGSKSKAHYQKLSGKSVNDTPSGKTNDLDHSTLKSKSKDTPKSGGKSKDTPKSVAKGKTQGSSKSSANGADKGKSSLSKEKSSHVQEKSPRAPESTKRKLSDSSKDQGSEAKSEQKRRRSVKG